MNTLWMPPAGQRISDLTLMAFDVRKVQVSYGLAVTSQHFFTVDVTQ